MKLQAFERIRVTPKQGDTFRWGVANSFIVSHVTETDVRYTTTIKGWIFSASTGRKAWEENIVPAFKKYVVR